MSTLLPISRVTLTEDRAQVEREGRVPLTPGPNRIVVEGVSPVIVDKTLRVSLEAASARLVSATVERLRITQTAELPAEARALQLEAERLAVDKAQLDARIARLTTRAALLDELQKHTLAELAMDTSYARLDVDRARADLARIDRDDASARAERVGLERDRAELDQRIARLQARQRVSPTQRESAQLVLHLEADAPSEAAVRVEYLVPGACWRPYHTAKRHGAKVTFTSDACVWQATGEDWTDVALVLSTERPSLGKSPPRLTDDVVTAQKKQPVLAVEVREQALADTGLGTGPKARGVPGIDDGGEVRTLRAERPATVPSDGRPHRFPLFRFDSDAESGLVLQPELAALAISRTVQTNHAPNPLLAGPVDLLSETGYVGKTKTLYVAPGEKFELGWGPDANVRVVRHEHHYDEEKPMLSSYITRVHYVTLHLSNIGDAPRTLGVTERVPVSELEKVQIAVEANGTMPAAQADKDGFVKWTVTVGAFGKADVSLKYTVKRHTDVVGL